MNFPSPINFQEGFQTIGSQVGSAVVSAGEAPMKAQQYEQLLSMMNNLKSFKGNLKTDFAALMGKEGYDNRQIQRTMLAIDGAKDPDELVQKSAAFVEALQYQKEKGISTRPMYGQRDFKLSVKDQISQRAVSGMQQGLEKAQPKSQEQATRTIAGGEYFGDLPLDEAKFAAGGWSSEYEQAMKKRMAEGAGKDEIYQAEANRDRKADDLYKAEIEFKKFETKITDLKATIKMDEKIVSNESGESQSLIKVREAKDRLEKAKKDLEVADGGKWEMYMAIKRKKIAYDRSQNILKDLARSNKLMASTQAAKDYTKRSSRAAELEQMYPLEGTISAPSIPSASMTTVSTEAQYNALPPGTKYLAPDGSMRTKK